MIAELILKLNLPSLSLLCKYLQRDEQFANCVGGESRVGRWNFSQSQILLPLLHYQSDEVSTTT